MQEYTVDCGNLFGMDSRPVDLAALKCVPDQRTHSLWAVPGLSFPIALLNKLTFYGLFHRIACLVTALRANPEDYLMQATRENTQLLLNKVWELKVERKGDEFVAKVRRYTYATIPYEFLHICRGRVCSTWLVTKRIYILKGPMRFLPLALVVATGAVVRLATRKARPAA